MALLALLFATLTSTTLAGAEPACRAADPTSAAKFEQDRRAILAMAGEYRVTFQFHETIAREPGYTLHEPHRSDATELIAVIADRGDFISLQHILVALGEDGEQPQVVKHWRQDWTYEGHTLTEFRGRRIWETVQLNPAEVTGTWTQAVYQVDDSPRYAAVGRWVHLGASSTWESQTTWRPLPRREHTTRDDYHVLQARNRHTITPTGWVHEQDNQKLVLDGIGRPAGILAHESGLNVYERADDLDLAAARVYWQRTHAFWQQVRAAWDVVLQRPGRISLAAQIDGQRLGQVMTDLLTQSTDADAAPHTMTHIGEAIRAAIGRYVAVP